MAVVKPVRRFDVWLVTLDPTQGSEIRKTRPCLVISPDEMNKWLRTVIVAPMTTSGKSYPSRVPITFDGKEGQVVLDQVRTLDKSRFVKRLGVAGNKTANKVADTLAGMFAI